MATRKTSTAAPKAASKAKVAAAAQLAAPKPSVSPVQGKTKAEPTLRTDGPTLKEFTRAGYREEDYPPSGYAARTESMGVVRPAEAATETDVAVGRFPKAETPEPGSGFTPAPGRFPEE